MRPLVLLALLLAAPLALAQDAPSGAIDATIAIAGDGAPAIDAPAGLVAVNETDVGERYTFDLTLERPYTTIEFRLRDAFDVERPRQIVPSLVVPDTEYPLFHQYVNERIWEAEGPARVFWIGGTADNVTLRVGVGVADPPRSLTLVIERDVTPPTFDLGKVQNVTHYSFYQETTTEELAIGDVQVRRAGSEADWVVNPTPELHYLQKFPVQGLASATTYEVRALFTDWAGNVATSETYQVTTAAEPILPVPLVTPISPLPNATLEAGFVTMRARVESPGSPLLPEGLTVFFDKRVVSSGIRFESGELVYAPPDPLAAGKHSFAVEVRNEAGGKGEAHWSFDVAASPKEAPAPALVALLAALACAAVLTRRS